MNRKSFLTVPSTLVNQGFVQMPNLRLIVLVLGVWTSTIPTGAILTESPLSPHVNPTSFPPLTKGVSGMSLSADHEIATFTPSSPSSLETKKTDELGSTRYNGKTNRSNKADYYKQQDSFFPSSHPSSSNNSQPAPFPSIMQATATALPASVSKPYQPLHFNGRLPATSEKVPVVTNAVASVKISTTAPSTSSSSQAAPGGKSELISSPFPRNTPVSSIYPYSSLSSETTTGRLTSKEGSDEELLEQQSKPIAFPDKPPFYSSTSPSEYGYGSTTEDGKQSNINLLRKLWASTSSGKLNLTDEHRSLLRIESKSGTPSMAKTLISPLSSSSPLPTPQSASTSSIPIPPPLLSLSKSGENTEQFQIHNPVTTTNRPTSISETSTRSSTSDARLDDLPDMDQIEVDGGKGTGANKEEDENPSPNSSPPFSSSLSSGTIKPVQGGVPLLSSISPSPVDMTSLSSFEGGESKPPFAEHDHVKESESNQQAPLLPVEVTLPNFAYTSPQFSALHLGTSSSDGRSQSEKKDDGEEPTVATTKLAFPSAENIAGTSGNVKGNLIRLKESSSSASSSSSATSADAQLLSLPTDNDDAGKAPSPPRQHHLMLYPEWLSSGGVYPDDDTSAQAGSAGLLPASSAYLGNGSSGNGGGGGAEYYTEPEYEPLISGEGSSVAHISSHLYNFAVPNRNLPPPPPLPSLTEEEEIRNDEEFKRYARLREKLADELLQDVVAAAGARRNWQNDRSSANIKNQMMIQDQPQGEEVEGIDERENRGFVGSSKLTSGGGSDGGVVSTESPQAIIAQQSGLADVISRGRIDSVMYVYFGDKLNDYHTEEIAGRVIQAIGGVIAAVAQVLTVLGAAKCVRRNAPTYTLPVHLHIGFALLISNLLLLLAVHATEPIDICATVAMILHYLHLVIGCWLFAHTVQTYRELRRHVEAGSLGEEDTEDHHRFGELPRRPTRPNIVPYCFAAWSAPLPFILVSYLVNPDGYETRHYCWMSIEKGMVVSFIVPVFLLIGMNTLLVVMSLRHLLALRKLWHDSSGNSTDVLDEHSLDEKMIGNGIRASAMLLPLLAVMWFLEVVALENATSIFFQVAAAVANIALSWLVMYFMGNEIWPEMWCQFSKVSRANSLLSMDDPCGGSSVQPSAAHLSFDNEPLLGFANTGNNATSSSSRPSSVMMMMPSTSKTTTTTASTTAAVSAPVSTSVAGPSCSTSTSFTAIVKKPMSGKYPYSTNKSKNLSPALTQSTPNGGLQQLQSISSIAPILTGKKSNKGGGGGGGLLMKSKPNWSQPGGNEIYELKLDSISTICK